MLKIKRILEKDYKWEWGRGKRTSKENGWQPCLGTSIQLKY